MITFVYGPKGSGKTKRLIDAANDSALTSDGNVVYVTDQPKHSAMVKTAIRFVDSAEYGIDTAEATLGFIKGILSSNNDITHVYIDGLARMTGVDISDMEDFYKSLESLGKKDGVQFVVTVSMEHPPEFIHKYI